MKLFEEKHHEWTKFSSWTQVDLLSQLPDLSLFFFFLVYLFCLFMQRHMWRMNTLFKLQGCLGERLSTRKWAENSTAGSVSLETPDFRLQCIVYCIWNCRVSTYCIYYQPLSGSKTVSKITTWTIRGKEKKKRKRIWWIGDLKKKKRFSVNSPSHLDFIVNNT